ncbi:MAG: hypothetical protein HKM95_12835 [Inquilinus sp.]|nr:hypothetical protein [Inquilinus sp.]
MAIEETPGGTVAPKGPSRWAPRLHLLGVSGGAAVLAWRVIETGYSHWTPLAALGALAAWSLSVHAAGRSFDLKTVRDIVRAVRKGT